MSIVECAHARALSHRSVCFYDSAGSIVLTCISIGSWHAYSWFRTGQYSHFSSYIMWTDETREERSPSRNSTARSSPSASTEVRRRQNSDILQVVIRTLHFQYSNCSFLYHRTVDADALRSSVNCSPAPDRRRRVAAAWPHVRTLTSGRYRPLALTLLSRLPVFLHVQPLYLFSSFSVLHFFYTIFNNPIEQSSCRQRQYAGGRSSIRPSRSF